MKFFTLVTLVFILSFTAKGQYVRFNIGSGIANYSGDIQQKWVTTSGSRMMFSTGVALDLNQHVSARLDVAFANISADDKNNQNPALVVRNLNFHSTLFDAGLSAEINLLSLDKNRFTPYVFAGMGVFHFNPFTIDSTGEKLFLQPLHTEGQGIMEYPNRKEYNLWQLNIPYGGGLKWAISNDVYLGAELSLRKIFTDYVDDVSTNYVEKNILLSRVGPHAIAYSYRGDELKEENSSYPSEGSIRGNPTNKDSYYFARVRLELRMASLITDYTSSKKSGKYQKSLRCPF